MNLEELLGCAVYADGSKRQLDLLKQGLDQALERARSLPRDPATDAVLTELIEIGRAATDAANGHRGTALALGTAAQRFGELALERGAEEARITAILESIGPAQSDRPGQG